jgi:ribosome-associated protein
VSDADALAPPLRELRFQYSRSSGPGGQNVNKVSSRATLRWDVAHSAAVPPGVRARFLERFATRITAEGELMITSQRFRDRGRNVADCIERLRAMLGQVARPPRRRRATRPGRAAKERRLSEKRRRSERKRARRGLDEDH